MTKTQQENLYRRKKISIVSRISFFIIFFQSTCTYLNYNCLPAQPFENVDNFDTSTDNVRATNFWHKPYAAKRMLFSATLAANDGIVPAYKPRTTPSFFNVSLSIRWRNQIIWGRYVYSYRIFIVGLKHKDHNFELLT